MIFHVFVLFASLFLFGAFEIALAFPSKLVWISAAAIILLWRFSWKIGGSLSAAVIPTLFALSTALILFFVSSIAQRHALLVLSTAVFYVGVLGIYRLRQYSGDKTARSMLALSAMASLFFFYSAFYGIFLNFRFFTQPMMMASFGGVTFLAAYHSFCVYLPKKRERARFFAIALGFLIMEIAWIAGFWPFGYLTTGVVVLIFLAVPWDIFQHSVDGQLSRKRTIAVLTVALLLLSMVLASSAWVLQV